MVVESNGLFQVVVPPNNRILVNAIGSSEDFPTPGAGDWAGANWEAPPGEVVTSISVAGDFRIEAIEDADFGAGVYGRSGKDSTHDKKIHFVTGSGEGSEDTKFNASTNKLSYDWSVDVDPKEAITGLQFRAWEALSGARNVQAGSDLRGYSGNITNIEIKTSPSAGTVNVSSQAEHQPADAIELGNSNVRAVLSRNGELLSLRDLVTNTNLTDSSQKSPAWRLNWRGAPKGSEDISLSEGFVSEDHGKAVTTENEDGSITSSRYDSPKVESKPDSVVFTWQKDTLPTVVGKVVFDPKKEQFHFYVTVDNQSPAIIDSISFPATLYFEAKPQSYMLVAADNEYNTSLKPLDKLKPFTTMYPGYLFMQMAGFKIGDSSLLVYTDDDKANVKWMKFDRKGTAISFDLEQQIRLASKKKADASYSVVLKTIPHGTYNELADTYGAWGREQWWAKEKLSEKLAKRPFLSRYFEGGMVRMDAGPPVCDTSSFSQSEDTRWLYIENNKYSKYEPYYTNIVDSMTAFEKAYNFQPGYWMPVWSGQQFDSTYPDYLPVQKHMGDFDKFKASLIEHGYPVLYHMNIAQWAETAPTAQDKKYLAVTDKGTPYRIHFEWSKMWSVLTSPAVALEVEMKTVNRIRDDAGINGIYLDVIGHSYATDENPLSPYHGKPNDYQLQKMLSFKTIREAITGPIMTEARNEIELAYIDMGTGGNGSPDEDEVPLWQMVYGDCVAITTYAQKDKRLRYYTWMLGGVNATRWDWPAPEGKFIPVYLGSAQQKVVSAFIPELMERFDRFDSLRLSQWASGFVLWNKAESGAPSDMKHETTLGTLEVSQISPGGIVIWTKSGEFSVDSVRSVKLNGDSVFSSSASLSVTYSGHRWVIHNESKGPVEATIQLPATAFTDAALSGKFVTSAQAVTVQPKRAGDRTNLTVTIPAEECLILGKSDQAPVAAQ